MLIWVFVDSSLFETLSRESGISIWRDGYTAQIVLFHILGVITAISIKINYFIKKVLLTTLFILSYLFYFMHEALLLSIVYPFVISYYNVIILQSLIKVKSFKDIGIYMIFIGWIASGSGLMVALHSFTKYVPLLLFIMLFYYIIEQINFKKGVISWLKG